MGSSKIDSFLNSIDISLKKRKYLSKLNTSVIKLLGDLLFMLDILKEKFETSNNPLHGNRIICIEDRIKYLIENCDTLCNNSIPTIENNTINLTLQDIQESKIIPYEEIIKNYTDLEDNKISDIIFGCMEGDFELINDGCTIKLDCPAKNFSDLTLSLINEEYQYFIKNNVSAESCEGEIFGVEKSFLLENSDLNILELKDSNGDFILQKITEVDGIVITEDIKTGTKTPEGKFCVSVIDDDCNCPLPSNEAEISLSFTQDCLIIPSGEGTITIELDEGCDEPYTLGPNSFIYSSDVVYIKIVDIEFGCNEVFLGEAIITPSSLPLVLTTEQILQGELSILSLGDYCTTTIKYSSAYSDSNFSVLSNLSVFNISCIK